MFRCVAVLIFLMCFLPCPAMAEGLLFVTLDNAPQAYIEDGKPVGFLTEIVVEAARRAGYEAKVRIVPWRRALAMAEKGTADAVFNAGFNQRRNEYLRFPETILITEKIVAIRKAGSKAYLGYDFSGAADLVVGVGRGFFYGSRIQQAIAEGLFKRIEEVPNIDQNIQKLLLGRIDILFADYYPVMKSLSDSNMLDKVEIISNPETGTPLIYSKSDTFLAFSRKKNPLAFNLVNAGIVGMKKDGSYKAIIKKYIDLHEGL
ncbi:transporter substrate-binding domain-containing protein [Maridesulfovibrio sp.]|uniref:substrate-binding periplasmic protein n=1 Tax=Maridesulfovibrio sp. TaxID=2795000 RepID=UPI002A18D0AA|nr:transporter substrate-binding domain-containing protein [Maridesulfovibrio sp.]